MVMGPVQYGCKTVIYGDGMQPYQALLSQVVPHSVSFQSNPSNWLREVFEVNY
jgi:hypothetical protein